MEANELDDLHLLKAFIKGLRDFMGRGGNRAVAESIHMQESAFSKFIANPDRHFDLKTFFALSLMQSLRREKVDGAELLAEGEFGPLIYREWQTETGELIYSWSPKPDVQA